MRRLCATVLIFEAIVIALAIPVAIKVGHVSGGSAGPAGGGLAGAAVLIAVAVGARSLGETGLRVALGLGSLLQLLMIASGVVVPAMYALGVIFTGLWIVAIWLAHTVESREAALAAAEEQASAAEQASTRAQTEAGEQATAGEHGPAR